MSYPFSNEYYAQQHNNNASAGYRPEGYGSSSAARIEYDNGPAYQTSYESDMHHNQHSHDDGNYLQQPETRPYNHREHDEYDAPSPVEKDAGKLYDEGNSPYGARGSDVHDPIYTNKSIWSRDDKRAMGKRSVPVKIIRALACLIINAIIVIISIISLVVIFARPINVGIGEMSNPSASSVGIDGSAITFNGSVNFIVSNPNSIDSDLTLTAKVYDKVNTKQDIGRGSVSNQKIASNQNTTITFPYQVRYSPTDDSDKSILQDLAAKCGLVGGSTGKLDLTLDINARVKILSVPVPVSFSQDVSFTCPITSDMLKGIGGGDLLQIIGSLTGSSTSKKRSLIDMFDDHTEL